MAYTTQQLVDFYTAANLGKTPDAATTLALDAYATQTLPGGSLTDAQALASTLKLVNPTTAVAIESYQFFTGRAPSAEGLAYLVNSTTNTNDLNDAAYAKFSQENRFINFAINLATGSGEGAASFANSYGAGVSYAQVVATAYDKVIGNAAAAAAGVDVAAAVAYLSRQANIDYLTAFVKANTGLTAAADIELAVKAALVGTVLNAATTSGIGLYAAATNAMISDLSDGSLSTNAAAGVNILTAYPAAGAVGTTYTLKTGQDTVAGGNANDTINALTIDAAGANATTLSSFDTIDGGGGVDTLNIYTDDSDNLNDALPNNLTVKNVEIVNLYNNDAGGVAALADASVYQGVQQLWQVGKAATVTNLGVATTAGFRDFAAAATLTVETAATAASAKVALSNVAEASTVVVDGNASDALAGVTLSGTVADTNSNGTIADTNLTFAVGKEVTSITVASSVATTLTVDDSASAAATKVRSVNLSGSTGAITFVGDADVRTITGGAAKDTLTIATATVKDDTATAADETVSALVESGAGNDVITVNTSGTGLTTVNTGAGNDTVNVTARGTTLKVDLGDGADTFTASVAITSADTIDAGAGSDTLLLSLVGVANVGAFKNFDVYDVKGLATSLDLDILNTNNTVTELVGSDDLGANVTVSNIATGVGFRATGDMGLANTLSLTQKTAGALTVTLDADQATEVAGDDVAQVSISAAAATSINAVFDTSYLAAAGAKGGEAAATDNVSTIALATQAATAVTVVSGGTNARNVLNITEGAGTDKLATVTVTGTQALTLSVAGSSTLTTIDASGATGGLTASLADLKDAGTIKLGTGVDVITATNTSTQAGIEAVQGFEKALAVSVSTAPGDATAKAAAIADADTLFLTGGAVADANAGVTTGTIANGVLTFTGAGPGTLTDALVIANDAANALGETVVFQYLGDSYVFQQTGAAADIVVKLTGVTGVTNLVENGATDKFFIV
jgi:S-layer protein